MIYPQISRRDFLKLAAAGSLAYALKDLRLDRALAAPGIQHGCMTISGVPLYDAPNFSANKIHHFGKDEVVEVTGIEENGEFGNDFNSTWYQINGEGYSYSGWVYPVEANYQKPGALFVSHWYPPKTWIESTRQPVLDTLESDPILHRS